MLHLFISTFQTSIELLSVITQNEEKYASFSREEGEKLEGVSSFRMLAIDTSVHPFHPKAVCKFTNLLSRKVAWKRR